MEDTKRHPAQLEILKREVAVLIQECQRQGFEQDAYAWILEDYAGFTDIQTFILRGLAYD